MTIVIKRAGKTSKLTLVDKVDEARGAMVGEAGVVSAAGAPVAADAHSIHKARMVTVKVSTCVQQNSIASTDTPVQFSQIFL